MPNDSAFDPQGHLTPLDIAVDCHTCPTLVRVHIKHSKTDPFRHGIYIFLGRSGSDLCPVSAILAYMAIRGRDNKPLFRFADGHPLTRQRLVYHLRRVLLETGVDTSNFSGHSFRIGAATTAAALGIEDSLIKTLGRWESAAYQRYVKLPRESLAAVSVSLGGAPRQAAPEGSRSRPQLSLSPVHTCTLHPSTPLCPTSVHTNARAS